MMIFREALEREIATQGISVAEVARKSRVSKGAIYNILNGTTEDGRVRPATRRALAKGCGRELKILPDGGVMFVAPVALGEARSDVISEVAITLLPHQSFLGHRHLREPFDWLYEQEERGKLPGLHTVDRVFQRRDDFLSLEVFNAGDRAVCDVQFVLRVDFDEGPSADIACCIEQPVAPDERREHTLFLLAGPPFSLELIDLMCLDAGGQVRSIDPAPTYRFEGDMQ